MEIIQIKNAFRIIFRRKDISIIIVVSLVVGFTNLFLLSGFVFHEYSIDAFHKNKSGIFKMQSDDPWVGGGKMNYITFATPGYIKNNFPEVKGYCHWSKQGVDEVVTNNNVYYQNIDAFETDPSFFNIFSYRFIEGDPAGALSGNNNIVLTKKTAHKFFGNKKATGNPIILKQKGVEKIFTVSAVVDQPGESHIKFDLVTSIEGKNPQGTEAYLLLKEGTDPRVLEEKLNAHKTEIPFFWEGRTVNYYLNNLEMVNITSDVKTKIYISLGIAIIILFIAFFNYINLYMNLFFDRTKEMGIIRLLGGTNIGLVKKMGTEISILVIFSVLLSLFVLNSLLPVFNQINGSNLLFSDFLHSRFLLIIFSVILLVAILSFLVILISVKSTFRHSSKYFEGVIRDKNKKLFTISTIQYAISIALLICTITLYRQISFIRHKEIGLDRDVVEFRLPELYGERKNEMKDALMSSSIIDRVSVCAASPVREGAMIGLKYDDMGEQKEYTVLFFQGDEDYLKTLRMELVEGHEFKQTATETKKMCYINEAMVKFFQMKDPIGKLVPGSDMEIAGVLKNFHWTGLESIIPPAVVAMSNNGRNLLVKIKDGHKAEGINLIILKTG
jgi:putative ABC transport system permease protein